MSYDIRIGVKVADSDLYAVIGEPEYSSPTYNIGDMFRKAMDWNFKQGEWYKLNDVIQNIEHGIHELQFNASLYKKYEPDNGWGSVSSALQSLQSIIKYITDPFEGLHGSWNGCIPFDHLYICW